eukprot:GHUV01008911.1.p1 GENE.GHUV01008911.1~~GHUV01008911.1.p1  ORF type:complete len:410 (+),score=61.73 GHUV01008911.1:192-1421(+)
MCCRTCELGFPAGTTVLFVADPGTFSSTPEAAVYLANLKENRALPSGSTACPSVHVGKIMRSNVAVITTGIGPMAAALCIYDILNRCGPFIRDIFFSGTSGWSPQFGGVITNGTCETGAANSDGKIARLGDVCVSPYSINWDCRQASWSQTAANYPDQCTFPQQNNGPSAQDLFGQCQFTNVTRRELNLADEVIAAVVGKANLLPQTNKALQALENQYWSTMAQGTRVKYPTIPPTVPPKVWTYKECMEIDSQYFWSGAPWDMVARSYVAEALNNATGGSSYNQNNVLAVSAMEGIGLSMAMQRYNSLSSTRRPNSIPYTYVRGMSDWVHRPLTYDPANKIWGQGPVLENIPEGYKYAITTASSVVLVTLQTRCLTGRYSTQATGSSSATVGPSKDRPGPLYPCTFTLA